MKSIYSRLQDTLIYVHLLLTFTHRTYMAGQSNSTCNDKETEYMNIYMYVCTYVHACMSCKHTYCTQVHTCTLHTYVCTYIRTYMCILVEGRIEEKNCAYISHVAQVSDAAQVTRQVSLLGLIA